ncbi:hypothetical protein A2572_00275 [Candidatus Collierbacteria bacterium RIFOXYD1_FULL_40_9]|uniref:Uncharacterized protein n=1 Tax=Candidatus Collierbacteria bacterium RIFOXYD1_FULL_40_9 TaxID=1817731 RepID=A0A1F5FV41_9BACT|nr:MAG: hypothetical protein A2572_00275 [Candidatus Collierbacteria bacterium RIFOXYD1_FULL_40_9]
MVEYGLQCPFIFYWRQILLHVHRPYLIFHLNSVRCSSFECSEAKLAGTELQNALPKGAKVTFANHRLPDVKQPMVYAVRVGDQYWCTMTDLYNGVLELNEFKGSKEEFKLFQVAVLKAFGIYNIHNGAAMITLSAVAP